MSVPFVVFALPRSRTAWLSQFLSYKDWHCGHEEIRHLRGLDDVKSWLSQAKTGSAETNAAPWWRAVLKYRPDVRCLVIRRPVEDVVESLMALDMQGVCAFNRDRLREAMKRLDAKLDQIEVRAPRLLSVTFGGLVEERVCKSVFEHCLPYEFDRAWWLALKDENVQCSMPAMMRYAMAHERQLEKLGDIVKQTLLADMALRRPADTNDGITIQRESFDTFFRDAQHLFAAHLVQVGERPSSLLDKNIPLMRAIDQLGAMQIMTARCNGRLFGYLMTIINPSLESASVMSAAHTTFFTSPEIRGLGIRLQRAALVELKKRGVGEVFWRVGHRGAGAKVSALCRRLGALENGAFFRLELETA